MEIVWVNKASEARRLVSEGFEPIECCFGNDSVISTPLAMDHHGENSFREGVAIRAYCDHFGLLKQYQKFVVTGAADADACFAIAALSGLLPHPSQTREFEKSLPHVKVAMTRDLRKLAELINRIDIDPIGIRLQESEEGCLLLFWNQLKSGDQDALAFYAGVDRWRTLASGKISKTLPEAARLGELQRVKKARAAKIQPIGPLCAFVESSTWGFDVWYTEVAPVIVAYVPTNSNVTVGVRDKSMAEKLFGTGGLMNVLPKLEPKGWGGREAVGGSPRGVKITREQALAAAVVIDSEIN